MSESSKTTSKYRRPLSVVLVLTVAIMFIDIAVMQVLRFFAFSSPWVYIIIEALCTSLIFLPVIYIFLFRPMLLPINERKRAQQELLKAQNQLEAHRAEVLALLETSQLLEVQEFTKTARSIFDICKNLIGASSGYVALLSDDGAENEVLFLDAGGLPCTVDTSLPMPIRGLRGEVYHSGEVGYENDFSNSEWMKFMPQGHVDLENVLFAPLVIDNKTVGLIGIANKPGGFTENDARIASAFGKIAAFSLRTSRTVGLLEKSTEHFRSVMETATDVIVTIDQEGNIIFWNQAAQRVFGYAASDVLNGPVTMIMPERFRQAHQDGLKDFLTQRGGKIVGKTVELVGLRADGAEFPIELSLASWNAGEEMFFTGIIRDITYAKATEEKLQKAYDMLEMRVNERTLELAIANQELQKGIKERTKAQDVLQRKNQLESTLNLLLTISVENYEIEEILDYALDQIVNIHWLTWQGKGVIFLIEDADELVLKAQRGLAQELQATCARVPFGRCICGLTASTREVQFVDAVDEKHHNFCKNTSPHGHYSVPIQTSGKLLGILTVYVKEHHRRNDEEEKFLIAIANMLAGLIERKRAEVEISLYHQQLEDLVEKRTAELSNVNEDLVNDIEERERVQEELKLSLDRLRRVMKGIIDAMVVTVETRDQYTAGHQRRVSNLARAIASEMGLSRDQIDGIRIAGILHDLGKISIPAEILTKPGKLTELEFSMVKNHARAGYEILKSIEFPWPVAQIVLQHHERINGSGYPEGLFENNILLEARIIGVADVVEAMASHRPYRPTLGLDKALDEIAKNRGIFYDATVVDICLGLFKDKGFKFDPE